MNFFAKNEIASTLASANAGATFTAEIISVKQACKLRVTCNWYYSALNCDPKDDSSFIWTFTKVRDGVVALSPPKGKCISSQLYASVRDDWQFYVQVQAPYSADWITAVARDEEISFKLGDLNMGFFTGFNSKYLAANDALSSQGGHSGYRVQSQGIALDSSTAWFIGIKSPAIGGAIEAMHSYTFEDIQRQLTTANITLGQAEVERIVSLLNG